MFEDTASKILVGVTAVIGLAIVAVLVSQQAQTPNVISAAAGGFSQIIGAAVSPVTGGGTFGVNQYGFGSFLGGFTGGLIGAPMYGYSYP